MLDFDESMLPWTDREDFPAELSRRVSDGQIAPPEAGLLERWSQDGFLLLPQAVPEELLDALWREYERAWNERSGNAGNAGSKRSSSK